MSVFIDEAQDLSLMQWDMTKNIWNKTEDTPLLQVMMIRLFLNGLELM